MRRYEEIFLFVDCYITRKRKSLVNSHRNFGSRKIFGFQIKRDFQCEKRLDIHHKTLERRHIKHLFIFLCLYLLPRLGQLICMPLLFDSIELIPSYAAAS